MIRSESTHRHRRAAQRRLLTFAQAVDRYAAEKDGRVPQARCTEVQWRRSLEKARAPDPRRHGGAGRDLCRTCCRSCARSGPRVYDRDRDRRCASDLERVLDFATVSGHRTGENPRPMARQPRHGARGAHAAHRRAQLPALQIDDAPRWYAALRARRGMSARALEFQALTASRSRRRPFRDVGRDRPRGRALDDPSPAGKQSKIPPSGRPRTACRSRTRCCALARGAPARAGQPARVLGAAGRHPLRRDAGRRDEEDRRRRTKRAGGAGFRGRADGRPGRSARGPVKRSAPGWRSAPASTATWPRSRSPTRSGPKVQQAV